MNAAPGPAHLLEVDHLEMHFPVKSGVLLDRQVGVVKAVNDVSFFLSEGETLGVVGESGCGKTTLARCVVRLLTPTAGTVVFRGQDISRAGDRALRPARRDLQMVFQNPYASLNPKRRVGAILAGALPRSGRSGSDTEQRVGRLLLQVGMDPEHAKRFPAEFSGGQRQRIGIARALAVEPRLLVLDEPVSALDVSVQAQVVNLLGQLQDDLGLAYIFVAHDLSVVRHVSDRIAVMYLGKIVELSVADRLYAAPIHWYTHALLAAVPLPTMSGTRLRDRTILQGEPGESFETGCPFRSRCPAATALCRDVEPPLVEYGDGRAAACHHPRNVDAAGLATAVVSPSSPLAAGRELPVLSTGHRQLT